MTLAERLAIAAEAKEIEAVGGDWTAWHVAAVLGCARSTVYDTGWLMRISRRVGKIGIRWTPAEVRREQAIASTATRCRPLRPRVRHRER